MLNGLMAHHFSIIWCVCLCRILLYQQPIMILRQPASKLQKYEEDIMNNIPFYSSKIKFKESKLITI